ncbi:MAG: hypothetical protein JSS52_09435 [Proteobacteria bacterium]|nr:hypothetical protein [Pseudomonadota bacterium]
MGYRAHVRFRREFPLLIPNLKRTAAMPIPMRACVPLTLLLLAACSKPAPQTTAPPASTPAPTAATASAAAPAAGSATIIDTEPEEKCTNEPRTDPDDKRPRCGGMGAPQASTANHSYRIDSVECPGGSRESIQACDVSKPFTSTVCGGMATITHTPTDDRSGTWTFKFQGAGGYADSSGTYTLTGSEESMTEHDVSNKICVHAAGRTICTAPRPGTATWTRIAACTN